jgi:hypothetical protein
MPWQTARAREKLRAWHPARHLRQHGLSYVEVGRHLDRETGRLGEAEAVERPWAMTAQPPRNDLLPQWLPRVIAVPLALGGCYWGLLLAPWLFQPGASPLALIAFGPGYLITFCYVVRAICTPAFGVRRFIWVASILVQGAWALWITMAMAERAIGGHSINEPLVIVAWWLFATVVSVVGLLAERPN